MDKRKKVKGKSNFYFFMFGSMLSNGIILYAA